MTETQPSIAIDCYLRASSAGEEAAVVDRLRGYLANGVIDDLTVGVWPDQVVLRPGTQEADAVERFRAFRAWADRHGVRISPPFDVRERATPVDDPAAVLVLPSLCLAVRVDGELASVIPHRTETTAYTVADALAELEAGNVHLGVPTGSPDDPAVPSSGPAGSEGHRGGASGRQTPDRCPACGGALATGQGLYACRACPWTGVVAGADLVAVSRDRGAVPAGPAAPVAPSASTTGTPRESGEADDDDETGSGESSATDESDRQPTHPSV